MKLKKLSLRYDYDRKDRNGINRVPDGYHDVPTIFMVVIVLFGTSDLQDPTQITIKHKGVRKPDTSVKFIDSAIDFVINDKDKITGVWVEDPDQVTSWILGEWKTRDGQTYAKAKVTFNKDHAIVDLEYTDPFVFHDILTDHEVMKQSQVKFLSHDGQHIPFEGKVSIFPDDYPIVASSPDGYYAAIRFTGEPASRFPFDWEWPRLIFDHKGVPYSVGYSPFGLGQP